MHLVLMQYFPGKVSVFGIILVRIFSHLDWIQRDTKHLSVFSLNTKNTDQKNSDTVWYAHVYINFVCVLKSFNFFLIIKSFPFVIRFILFICAKHVKTFSCSKATIETLEKGVKYVQKVPIKTAEQHHRRCSCVFSVNFDHISEISLVFLLLTLNIWENLSNHNKKLNNYIALELELIEFDKNRSSCPKVFCKNDVL